EGAPVSDPAPAEPMPAPPAPDFSHGSEPAGQPYAPEHTDAPDQAYDSASPPASTEAFPPSSEGFDVAALPPEERELHRRADRVAKVAMQDIKMLHPDQVSLGKERKDLCARLSDDIERARKEYDRRF